MKLRYFIIVVIMGFALSGCSHFHRPVQHDNPEDLPDIIDNVLSLNRIGVYPPGYSVYLVNELEDRGPEIFQRVAGHKHIANYYEWTQFLIDEWTQQLEVRGVEVTPDSPNVLLVSISNFNWVQGFWVVMAEMDIRLEKKGTNWFTVHHGIARRPIVDFSAAAYQALGELLQRPDVLDQMQVP